MESREMHWSMNIHMTENAKPEIVETMAGRTVNLVFFGDVSFPDITLFAKTDAHRRWMAAMVAASEEFWQHEAVGVLCNWVAEEDAREEAANNGQFGVGA